jgi:hypothetical protein
MTFHAKPTKQHPGRLLILVFGWAYMPLEKTLYDVEPYDAIFSSCLHNPREAFIQCVGEAAPRDMYAPCVIELSHSKLDLLARTAFKRR